jgi:hypothetical protein
MSQSLQSLQFDIHQRYAFLRSALYAAFPDTTHPVRLLDVGCGPSLLSARFLGPRFQISRADVDDFNDLSITVIEPNAPFPLADRSFDVAIAMDVLEHIPEEGRDHFLSELYRVADSMAIFAFPHADKDVEDVEKALNACYKKLANHENNFLAEHAKFGLPSVADVSATMAALNADVIEADNCALGEWLLFNELDLLFACHFGDGDEKAGLNRKFNETAAFCYARGKHYRKFVFACRSPELGPLIRGLVAAERSSQEPSISFPLPSGVVEGIVDLVGRLSGRCQQETAALQAQIRQQEAAALQAQIRQQEAAVREAQIQAQLQLRDQIIRQSEEQVRELQLAQDRLDAILKSRSWRLMGVFRWMFRLVRQGTGGIAGLLCGIVRTKKHPTVCEASSTVEFGPK